MRSLEAHLHGVQGVAGSIPVSPTTASGRMGTQTLPQSVNKPNTGVNKTTVSQALDSFISSPAHRSPKTTKTLKERLLPFEAYLNQHGVENALDITERDVSTFLLTISKGRRGKPLTESSMFGFEKDVRAFLNHVEDNLAPEGWIHPWHKRRLRPPEVRIHPLSARQVKELLALIQSEARNSFLRARNRAIFLLLLDGALRVGELIGAQRNGLGDAGILRVMGKGDKEREVSLSDETLRSIEDYLKHRVDDCQFLFVSGKGGPLSYYAIKSLFHRLRKVSPEVFSGVRLSAHTLRHTSATLRRRAGMSEGDLQTYLGHSSPEMTRHYSNLALSEAANVAARRTSPIRNLLDVERESTPSR